MPYSIIKRYELELIVRMENEANNAHLSQLLSKRNILPLFSTHLYFDQGVPTHSFQFDLTKGLCLNCSNKFINKGCLMLMLMLMLMYTC